MLSSNDMDETEYEREPALRPKYLNDFVGQKSLIKNLQTFIDAAKKRNESLDHTLFYGPPGLGKTTLAHIIAHEMGVNCRATSGPVISKAGDLAALLTGLEQGDILFIDEIHRLSSAVEEILYPAMEDYKLNIMIGEGPAARSIEIALPSFTLVAATTRAGMMTKPLRERFGIPLQLEFYLPDELAHIITRAALLLSLPLSSDAALEIAKRSRGTPRIALRLLKRVRDFWQLSGDAMLNQTQADQFLQQLEIDSYGLDKNDRDYLHIIAQHFAGGPVGLESLAASLSTAGDSLEELTEPYLIQQGLLQRTSRGRLLTLHAYEYLGLPIPQKLHEASLLADAPQTDLFE